MSSPLAAAVIAKLANDATLTSLAPGGVFRDVAPQDTTGPYMIVTQMAHEDVYQQVKALGFESALYLVKAVQSSTSASGAMAAAARAHVLLQSANLTITGFNCMDVRREERVEYVEIDNEGDRRFQHRGGMYRVEASPA